MAARYEAMDIARWFLAKNQDAVLNEKEDKMSLLKLLKLLYYAEGCFLAITDESLFDDPIVAWEHGPVVESVWRKYHNNPYNLEFGSNEDYEAVEKISNEDEAILDNVLEVFGKYSAWGLRNKTHEEDPWKIATNNGRQLNKEIDRGLIKDYFKNHYLVA